MSESAAQSWLAEHEDQIPALDVYHRQALETLENETSPLAQLADIVALDPGMSVSLYRQVNNRQKKAGRAPLGTIHNALGQLGDKAVADFVLQHKTLGSSHANTEVQQAYHQLMSQAYHLLSQLNLYTTIHAVASLNEIRSAAVLYNIGELCACLFDYERYRKFRERISHSAKDAYSAETEFGFEFEQLGREIASQWCLPDLISEALPGSTKSGRQARLIQLAANVSREAETGWNHPALQASFKASAKFLNRPQQEIETKSRSVAIQSAREFPIADVFPAAARLILLPDVAKTASLDKPVAANSVGPVSAKLSDTIRALLKSPKATPAQIINSAINDLYDRLEFTRVVLIAASQDGQTLGPRLSRGLTPDSAFHSLQIETAQSGLFKSLMSKPQALWVSPANYQKYHAMLPGVFTAAGLSEHFFLMSLFIGRKPAGFVFCDRSGSGKNLDAPLYSEFKSSLMVAHRALALIAQRSRVKAA